MSSKQELEILRIRVNLVTEAKQELEAQIRKLKGTETFYRVGTMVKPQICKILNVVYNHQGEMLVLIEKACGRVLPIRPKGLVI